MKNEDTVTDQKEYEALFENAGDTKAIGESSPAYLAVVPDAPEHIQKIIPDVKMIAILRDPAERAYSHFLMRRRQGRELRESFEQCIEETDIDPERSYKSRGFYGEQIECYLKYFDIKQLKIFLYEDFCNDPHSVIAETFKFLEVDPSFKPDISERYNANPPTDPISDEMRKKLIEIYREDILKLQKLIGRDSSRWLS